MIRIFSRRLIKYKSVARVFYSTNNHPKEVNVVRSQLPPVEIPNVVLSEYIWKDVSKWLDKTALECLETGRKYKYHEVRSKSLALAKFLRNNLKLKPGDTIAIALPNVPEYAIVVLGSAEAGLKITTVNPIYTPDEISKQFVNSEPLLVFTLPELWTIIRTTLKKIHREEVPIVTLKHKQSDSTPAGAIDLKEICETKEAFEEIAPNVTAKDTLFLPYSGGTTGLPKGVELTHKNIVSNLSQVAAPQLRLNVDTEGSQQDVVPLFLPLFHIYGLVVVFLNMFSLGCKLVTIPKFGSHVFMRLLEEQKPNILYAAPPVVLMIVNNPSIQTKQIDSLRTIISAAGPLGIPDVVRFKEKTKGKVDLFQVYGMTETSPITLWQTRKLKNLKIGGSGFAVPNTECKIVAIADNSNTGLGVNQSGELLIRGPQNMKGYYKNEQATREIFTENGWLRTGDIAHYDEDEHFFVTDRLKELIKVKGFQVAPAELESVIRDHPEVADAGVIGVQHPVTGEAPKAFVVLKEGSRVKADDIKEYVASKVANYKALTGGVVFVDSVPRTNSGKLLRRELKKM